RRLGLCLWSHRHMGSSSFVDVPVFSRRPVRPVLFRLTYHRSFLLSCQPFPESIGCRCTACPVVAAARYFSPGGSPGCGRLPPCPLRKTSKYREILPRT